MPVPAPTMSAPLVMVHPLALVRYHADMFEHVPSGLDARVDRRKHITRPVVQRVSVAPRPQTN